MAIKPVITVQFDPTDKFHRSAVRLYMKRNAWADSPVRFTYDPHYGSIDAQVKSKLLEWYISNDNS
jgi:hypothetical protein